MKTLAITVFLTTWHAFDPNNPPDYRKLALCENTVNKKMFILSSLVPSVPNPIYATRNDKLFINLLA